MATQLSPSHHRLQPPAAVDGPNDARQSVSDQSAALWPVADIVGSPIRCRPYAKPSPRGRSHRSSLRGTTARRVEAASSTLFAIALCVLTVVYFCWEFTR